MGNSYTCNSCDGFIVTVCMLSITVTGYFNSLNEESSLKVICKVINNHNAETCGENRHEIKKNVIYYA